jgi:hypothetical protein
MNVDNLAATTASNVYSSIDLVLGGVFVLFYSGSRFNTPATNRSSTTAGRYFVSLFLYCLAGISFYAMLVGFPHLLELSQYGQQIGSLPSSSKISLPLFVALLLTVLLPKVPLLSSADKWVYKQLQDMASIPWEVLRLSAELRRYKLQFTTDERAVAQEILEADGFDPKDIVFELTKSPASDWTRLTALLQKVEDWRSDRRMAGYLAASSGELEKLRSRHQALSSKAKTCFHLLNEEAKGGASRKSHEATVRYQEDFTEHVGQLRQDACEFIARGVLRAELTNRALENRLKSMGFQIPWPDPPFSLNQLLLLSGVVCIIMLSGFVLFGGTFNDLRFEIVLTRAILISVIYSVAVACAVLPKTRWSFARAEVGDVRPIGFYLVAGLMSASISQLTSLVFQTILMGRLDWAWQRSLLTYPWLLVSFATALITAMMVDNPRLRVMSPKRQRCLEGLVQGVLMLGVTALTYLWLYQRVHVVYKHVDLSYLEYELPQPIMILVMGAVVGFVIGFFIPTWYRRHHEESAAENVGRLTLAGAAATEPRRTIISV